MGTAELTAQLHRDIWGPFVQSYAERDADAFGGLHAPDLIRAEGAGGWAGGLDAYLARVRPFFDDMTANGAELSIGFRFAERIVVEDVASERGVYRIVMALPGEPERVVYGRFHTFARKIDGRWRIAVDYDTDDATEADYAAAAEG